MVRVGWTGASGRGSNDQRRSVSIYRGPVVFSALCYVPKVAEGLVLPLVRLSGR